MDLNISITICEPDASWPDQFERERDYISHVFGSQLVNFHHVGSTAIAHLPARAIIDVLVEVTSLDALAPFESMWQKLNLENSGPRSGINYRFFRRLPPKSALHFHVFEAGDPQIEQWLNLTRYLKAHPSICQLFGKLKRKLMLDSHGDPIVYEKAKMRFIQQAMIKSQGLKKPSSTPPRALHRFISMEQIKTRVWDNYSFYLQTLFRYSPRHNPVPFPGFNFFLHQESDIPLLSPSWRVNLKTERDLFQWKRFMKRSLVENRRARSFLLSPFEHPLEAVTREILECGFRPERKRYFDIIPCHSFEVFTDDKTHFARLLKAEEIKIAADLLARHGGFVGFEFMLEELSSSLYTHGEPIEVYLSLQGHSPKGAFALCFYGEGLGIVHLAYKDKECLREIVNFAIQRAHALGYTYLYTATHERDLGHLREIGFYPLFTVDELTHHSF